jgi:hypothetical protein
VTLKSDINFPGAKEFLRRVLKIFKVKKCKNSRLFSMERNYCSLDGKLRKIKKNIDLGVKKKTVIYFDET